MVVKPAAMADKAAVVVIQMEQVVRLAVLILLPVEQVVHQVLTIRLAAVAVQLR
jgi:hypothetical protein